MTPSNRLVTDPEGWIEWSGGENPVPGCWVNIRQRGYRDDDDSRWWADQQRWNHGFDNPEARATDIIAYRLVTAAEDRGDGYGAQRSLLEKAVIDRLADDVRTRNLYLDTDGYYRLKVREDDLRCLLALVSRLEEGGGAKDLGSFSSQETKIPSAQDQQPATPDPGAGG